MHRDLITDSWLSSSLSLLQHLDGILLLQLRGEFRERASDKGTKCKDLLHKFNNYNAIRVNNCYQLSHQLVVNQHMTGFNLTLRNANCLFFERKDQNNQYFLYVPVYAYIKIKNLNSMSFEQLNAEVNLSIYLTFYTKGIPAAIVERMKEEIVVMFGRDQSIQLKHDQSNLDMMCTPYKVKRQANNSQNRNHQERPPKYNSNKKQTTNSGLGFPLTTLMNSNQQTTMEEEGFTFKIRKMVNTQMQAYIFLTPFELVDLIFTLTIRRMRLITKDHKQLYIWFNMMDRNYDIKEYYNKIAFTEEGTFAYYDLAEKRMWVEYTASDTPKTLIQLKKNIYNCEMFDNKREKLFQDKMEGEEEEGILNILSKAKKEENNQVSKLSCCQTAHYHMPVYKLPNVTLCTIIFPLWLLGAINLAIFMQGPSLADRIASISAMMLAFVSLISIIREQVPPNPKITFTEILVYLQTLTNLFCLIQSFINKNIDQDDFQYVPWTSIWFMLSFIITIIVFVLPILMFTINWAILEPSHNIGPRPFRPQSDFSTWVDNQQANQNFIEYWEHVQNLREGRTRSHRQTFFVEDTPQFTHQMQQLSKLEFIKESSLL